LVILGGFTGDLPLGRPQVGDRHSTSTRIGTRSRSVPSPAIDPPWWQRPGAINIHDVASIVAVAACSHSLGHAGSPNAWETAVALLHSPGLQPKPSPIALNVYSAEPTEHARIGQPQFGRRDRWGYGSCSSFDTNFQQPCLFYVSVVKRL
jgi:hypothetical protein